MIKGTERPPNEAWCEDNVGQRVRLEFEDETYVVDIREVDDKNET